MRVNIHRFHDKIAVSIMGEVSRTLYLDAASAAMLARELYACRRDIVRESDFCRSTYQAKELLLIEGRY